jgi:hypothetical protein
MDNQEKDFLDDVDTYIKPKKQLSEQKLQHLQNIRVKALEKKKQMKEITEKANKLKELESLKEAKKIQKEQLAKKYDEMIENSKPKEEEVKPKEEEVKPKEEIKEVKPKEEIKEVKPIKKKKIIKKIIYQEASSSDSDDADEVVRYDPQSGSYHLLREVVKVKKPQAKNKNNEVEKPQPQPQNINNSYSNLLYEASVDKLKNRMMDERAKHLIMSVMPNYG